MFIAASFVTGASWKPQMGRERKVKQAAVPCSVGHSAVTQRELTHAPGGARGHGFEHVTIGRSQGAGGALSFSLLSLQLPI